MPIDTRLPLHGQTRHQRKQKQSGEILHTPKQWCVFGHKNEMSNRYDWPVRGNAARHAIAIAARRLTRLAFATNVR